MSYDYLVFICRCQPLHYGHLQVINQALDLAPNLIIILGSANSPRTTRNPFTFAERVEMISEALGDKAERVTFAPAPDILYNDDMWVSNIQRLVNEIAPAHKQIGLIGCQKDFSSYYLKLFPNWSSVSIRPLYVGGGMLFNSTFIREQWLMDQRINNDWMPSPIGDYLERFKKTDAYALLQEEFEFDRNYDPRAFDNDIVCCVDAVVIQSGHVLLVRRKNVPGKGLLALPGGHVNKDETFIEAVVRELKEETMISDRHGKIPPGRLQSYIESKELFDNPNRSSRARVISMAYLFRLPNQTELFSVKGDDDAESAHWVRLGDIRHEEMFEDHGSILMKMVA